MVRPVINSEKKIGQYSVTTVMSGIVSTTNIVSAVASPTGAAASVAVGSIVKAVFVELWFNTSANQPGSLVAILEKLPGSSTNVTAVDMAALNDYTNKKNVLYTTQGFVGDANANPTPFFRGWFKIPKGKQRFGLNDRLQFSVFANSSEDLEFCGLTIFKVYN